MLDLLEALGIDVDGFDCGHSLRVHSKLFPRAQPQSLCSRLIEADLWPVAWLVGVRHCVRSWERYH
jgi:hypothetical protein